jgi:photosystem II stability/assembly factor-like uncharacterized protein
LLVCAALALGWSTHDASAGPWTNANPGAGGAFVAIGAGPSGIVLCGSDLGGAYRSLDRGASWEAIGPDRGLTSAHVSAVGFDPADANIQYLGGEWGVYRSANAGQTFTSVTPPYYICAIAPAPSNPSIVYAPSHPTYDNRRSLLFKSVNRGLTWDSLQTNLPAGLRITKTIVHPTNPNLLYLVSSPDLFISDALPSLWKSADGGVTWSRMGAAIGKAWDLAIDPSQAAHAVRHDLHGHAALQLVGAVWKSVDGGANWTQKATHGGCVRVNRDQPQVLWVIDPDRDSGDPESGVWWSQDGGATWARKSTMSGWDGGWQSLDWAYSGSAYGEAKAIGQDLSDPNALYRVDWQFVFGSFDGGGRFVNLFTNPGSTGGWHSRGIEDVCVAAAAISESSPNTFFTGYYDIGMWRSLDAGVSWESCNSSSYTGAWNGHGGCASAIVPDPTRAGVVFAVMGEEAGKATVVKSTNFGGHTPAWARTAACPRASCTASRSIATARAPSARSSSPRRATSTAAPTTAPRGPRCCGNSCHVTAVDRIDRTTVYAGGEGGLWRSTGGGASGTWTRVGPSGWPAPIRARWRKCGGRVFTPSPRTRTAGRLYVTAYGAGRDLYRSDDRGATWTKLHAGLFVETCRWIASNASIVYLCSSAAYKSGGVVAGSEACCGASTAAHLDAPGGPALAFAGPMAIDPRSPSRVLVGSPGTGSGSAVTPPTRFVRLP